MNALSVEELKNIGYEASGLAAKNGLSVSECVSAMVSAIADAAIAADRAARAEQTTTYVQSVPDHCDRITWRGRYFHLPIAPPAAPVVPEGIDEALRALAKVHGWKFVWGHAKALAEGTNRCHKCHGDGLTHSSRCFHYNADGERASMLAAAPAPERSAHQTVIENVGAFNGEIPMPTPAELKPEQREKVELEGNDRKKDKHREERRRKETTRYESTEYNDNRR